MNAGQYNRLMDTLGEIIERMPEKPDKSHYGAPGHCTCPEAYGLSTAPDPECPTHGTRAPHNAGAVAPGPLRKVAQRQALYNVLLALDAWTEGARENHDAMEHRGENSGEECWRTFTPADIRRMVNDTARELELTEFPLSTIAKEDQV